MKYTIQQKARERDPERVWLDDKDCVRMRRSEFEATRMMIGASRFMEYAAEDLQERLEMVPDGKARLAQGLRQVNEVVEDVIGTMTVTQCRQVRNTLNDMVMKLMPKLSPTSSNVLMEKDIARGLIDIAMEKCKGCTEDGVTCKACALYQVLEAISPMQEYSELSCPYALTHWE